MHIIKSYVNFCFQSTTVLSALELRKEHCDGCQRHWMTLSLCFATNCGCNIIFESTSYSTVAIAMFVSYDPVKTYFESGEKRTDLQSMLCG